MLVVGYRRFGTAYSPHLLPQLDPWRWNWNAVTKGQKLSINAA